MAIFTQGDTFGNPSFTQDNCQEWEQTYSRNLSARLIK